MDDALRHVRLHGALVPLADACLSPEDRGFLFADGVYEAVACYSGRPFRWAEHAERLERGLAALLIRGVDVAALAAVLPRLQEANGLADADSLFYLQVTRGAAPRAHAFPRPAPAPTVYADLRPLPRRSASEVADGVAAISVPDQRWGRCDIKTTALVANVLAQQEAAEAGAYEALLDRDGAVVEGSHSSLFSVRGGLLYTHPEGPHVLSGVTRALILELAAAAAIPVRQAPTSRAELAAADEIFLAGTSTEVLAVVRLDGRAVGDGRPGPVTVRLRRGWEDVVAAHRWAGGATSG